jgi:ATP-dependent DNA helicase RecQ
LNEVREDERTINRISRFLEKQNDIKLLQFEAVIDYVANATKCKSRLILEYFNEENVVDCGICSYCIGKTKTKRDTVDITYRVLELLKAAPSGSREIEEKLDLTSQETIFAIKALLDNEKIRLNTNNQYYTLT